MVEECAGTYVRANDMHGGREPSNRIDRKRELLDRAIRMAADGPRGRCQHGSRKLGPPRRSETAVEPRQLAEYAIPIDIGIAVQPYPF